MREEDKKKILENIEAISAEELFKYVFRGEISLDEMKATQKLDLAKRRKIEDLTSKENIEEDKVWNAASVKATTDAFTEYLKTYPNGRYSHVARTQIEAIQKEKDNSSIKKKNILDRIKQNPNGDFTPGKIQEYIRNGEITESDLISIGIPQDVIETLSNYYQPNLTLGDIPEKIPDGYTEVYFWGIPGSGKTTAISGILSHAHREGILDTQSGNGFFYMNQLKNIFISGIGFLPAPTTTEVTQCLPFDLKDDKGKKHPIALIELSGEIFECFFYKAANKQFPGDTHENTFNTLTKFLSGSNRKVHFFVIDLSIDSQKLDAKIGMSQADYLDAAQKYFKENNILKKSTDAIYIIATKSDLLDCSVEERANEASRHLKTNFAAFVNVLKDATKSFRINDNSSLKVVPFCLGKVYFNYICKFNNRSSSEIIKILQQKTGTVEVKSNIKNFFNS